MHFGGFHLASLRKSSGRIFKIFASKNKGISHLVQTHFGSSLPASFAHKVLGAISRFVHPKTKRFAVKFRHILEVLCLARFMKKVLDAFSRFFCPKTKLFVIGFRCIFGSFLHASFIKKVLSAIPHFMRPKTKLFAVMYRCILEVIFLRVLQKKFWAQFNDLCVQR